MFFTLIWLIVSVLPMSLTSGCTCCGQEFKLTATSERKNVTSPGFPFSYPNNEQCNWKITALVEDEVIRFQVLQSHLNSDFLCKEDYAEIRDGETQYGRKIVRWCGDETPSLVETKDRHGYLLMRTNHQDVATGFNVQYWTVIKAKSEFANPSYTLVNYILFGFSAFLFLLLAFSLLTISLVRKKRNVKPEVKKEEMSPSNLRYRRPVTAATTTISTSNV